MKYKVEQIGAQFNNRAISNLEGHFNRHAKAGYHFHSVFQIQKPGCLGITAPTITYLAVYVKEEGKGQTPSKLDVKDSLGI